MSTCLLSSQTTGVWAQGFEMLLTSYLLVTTYYLPDLARLPGLLCLGSAELVLPCSLPCFALSRPPASNIRESTRGAARSAASLMRLVGSIGKAKQGRLQGKTNSAEPRQSKPGSRAKSVRAKGPKGPCKGPIPKCWAKGPKGPCMGPISQISLQNFHKIQSKVGLRPPGAQGPGPGPSVGVS